MSRKQILFILVWLFVVLFVVLSVGCAKPNIPEALKDIKIWAGDSANVGITRKQDNITIKAEDPKFDDYAALSYSDLNKIIYYLSMCQSYPSDIPMLGQSQLKSLMGQNKNDKIILRARDNEPCKNSNRWCCDDNYRDHPICRREGR